MKPLFKNRTKYTKQNYRKYLEFHQKKFGFKYKIYTLFIVLIIIICIVLQIQYHNYLLGISFILACIIFWLWRYFRPRYNISKELKKDILVNEKEFSFKFYEKYFEVWDRLNLEKVKYGKIYRVYETDSFFYLYLDKEHSLLLGKTGFVIGKSEDFGKFIRKVSWRSKFKLPQSHN